MPLMTHVLNHALYSAKEWLSENNREIMLKVSDSYYFIRFDIGNCSEPLILCSKERALTY